MAGAATPRGFDGPPNPHIEKWAYLLRAAKWSENTVYVCWENAKSDDETERNWVRESIARTWERESALRFKGWKQCGKRSKGIRIKIEDSGPHVKALGQGLDGLEDGMVLNFNFTKWSRSCNDSSSRRRACIESIAVHEFGHAIGLSHEQNRPDAPGECAQLRQGSDGDLLLTPYDPSSVMNYCNPVYNNNGMLSELDAKAVHELYKKRQ